MGISMHRSHYPIDTFEFVGATGVFRGLIELRCAAGPRMVEKVVDGTVKVTTVADIIRDRANNYWKTRESAAGVGMVLSGVALLGAGLGGLAGGVGVGVIASETVIIGGAVGIASLVVLAVSGVVGVVALAALAIAAAIYTQARKQHGKWEDPVAEIGCHRRLGDERGYPYLRKRNDLRTHAFAPEEATTLAFRTMDRYLEQHRSIRLQSQTNQAGFVDEFFSGNPLAATNRTHAFGSDDALAENLRGASLVYREHEASYLAIVRAAQAQRQQINRVKDAELSRLNLQKNVMVQTLNCQHEMLRHSVLVCSPAQQVTAIHQERGCDVRGRGLPARRVGTHLHRPQSLATTVTVHSRTGMTAVQRARLERIDYTHRSLLNQVSLHFHVLERDVDHRAVVETSRVNEWEHTRKQLFITPIGHILEAFVNGRDFDRRACHIEEEAEVPVPEVNMTFVFPNFDLSDLQEFDQENIFELNGSV